MLGSVVLGSVVPSWREGLDPDAPAPDYQRLVEVLAGGGEVMNCRRLAAALSLEVVAAKVEGVRSKVKRLFRAGLAGRGTPGDVQRARRASQRLMTMLIDHRIIVSEVSVRVS